MIKVKGINYSELGNHLPSKSTQLIHNSFPESWEKQGMAREQHALPRKQ